MATTTSSPSSLLTTIQDEYLDPEKGLPIIINTLIFVLYVICFVCLYRPYLVLIGYGLFFTLHMIMSIGMIKNILTYSPSDDFNRYITLFLNMKTPVSWTLFIGLLFLFISLLLLIITFAKLHAKHSAMNSPTLPTFLEGGNGEVKSGYTFKQSNASGATQGQGYYLNKGQGVDLFFNDTTTQKNVKDFTIIGITTTVLIWVQYLLYTNYKLVKEILSKIIGISDNIPTFINILFLLFGIGIVILSSVCIWLTNKINTRTKYKQDPINKNQSSVDPVQPTQPSIYNSIKQMLKTGLGI
jgi:hypothetical protein